MRPTSTPPCGAGLNAIRASTSTSPRPPGSTWSSACSPISPVVVCVGDAFAVSPNSNQRSDATLTTATLLPNRSFGPKGPTPSFENTNGLNGTLFRGRDTSWLGSVERAGRHARQPARPYRRLCHGRRRRLPPGGTSAAPPHPGTALHGGGSEPRPPASRPRLYHRPRSRRHP